MDDALALIVALKTANLRVRAVTSVSGNLPAARCYGNVHAILRLMDAPTTGPAGVAHRPRRAAPAGAGTGA